MIRIRSTERGQFHLESDLQKTYRKTKFRKNGIGIRKIGKTEKLKIGNPNRKIGKSENRKIAKSELENRVGRGW